MKNAMTGRIVRDNNEEAAQLRYLKILVRQVLNDLPSKRDWLDPQLERNLRVALDYTPRQT